MKKIGLLAVLVLMVLGAHAAPTATTQQAAAVELRQKIVSLQRIASGTDRPAADAAIEELKSLGEPANAALRDVVRQRLIRDRSIVDKAASILGDPGKLSEAQKETDKLRKLALANIAKLEHDETLKLAHQYYDRLMKLTASLNAAAAMRDPVLEAMAHRGALLKIWRDLAPETDTNFKEEDEAKLKETAEKILGMKVKDALEISPFDNSSGPEDPAKRAIWFYRGCRMLEAYNKTMESVMDAEEAKNARMVNAYREALGLVPYEIDARLVQSARRHSKEMVDLKYFSHESPTESEKLFTTRIKNAGYDVPFGENIAAGVADGAGTFWMWFDSPGHHKNMAAAGARALGVGRWGSDFTQNMGAGKRLVLETEEQRKRAAIKGEILKPDTGTSPRRK